LPVEKVRIDEVSAGAGRDDIDVLTGVPVLQQSNGFVKLRIESEERLAAVANHARKHPLHRVSKRSVALVASIEVIYYKSGPYDRFDYLFRSRPEHPSDKELLSPVRQLH